MEKLIDQLREAQKENKNRVERLAETIQNDKKTIIELENEHQNLILADQEEKADELFNKIYDLKKQTAKNESKYNVLTKSSKVPANVVDLAKNIFAEVEKEKERLANLEKKKEAELEELREVYFKKIEEIGEVNKEQKKVEKFNTIANYAINPKYQEPYQSSYHSDMRKFRFQIDKEDLIWKALEGKRTEGVTR